MKNRTLRLNNLNFHGSTCDGPGIRNVVFFQGCTRHCPGCHNMGTSAPEGGREIEIADLVSNINKKTPMRRITISGLTRRLALRCSAGTKKTPMRCITISGSESLLQPEGLLEPTCCLRQRGYEIAVYTGNSLEEVPKELLEVIDYIKVGKYQRDYQTSVKQDVGFTNQKFIKLR